jgi:hypothetical protein
LLLSIVALADYSCEDFAISQKVKHKEPDGRSHNPTRDFFFKVLFLSMSNNCKLHKNRPGSFFAHKNHLIKTVPQVQKHSLIRHKQIRHSAEHTRSLNKVNLQTHSGAELMQLFFSCHIAGYSLNG